MGMGEKGRRKKIEGGEKGETGDVVGRRRGLKVGMCVAEGKSTGGVKGSGRGWRYKRKGYSKVSRRREE